MKFILLMIAAAVLLAEEPGDAEKGKRLYTKIGCYECHGRVGQGGGAGPRLAPRPIPLQVLITYVRHPSGAMPPYTGKVVSDGELADIYAFLKSIPAPLKDVPQHTGP